MDEMKNKAKEAKKIKKKAEEEAKKIQKKAEEMKKKAEEKAKNMKNEAKKIKEKAEEKAEEIKKQLFVLSGAAPYVLAQVAKFVEEFENAKQKVEDIFTDQLTKAKTEFEEVEAEEIEAFKLAGMSTTFIANFRIRTEFLNSETLDPKSKKTLNEIRERYTKIENIYKPLQKKKAARKALKEFKKELEMQKFFNENIDIGAPFGRVKKGRAPMLFRVPYGPKDKNGKQKRTYGHLGHGYKMVNGVCVHIKSSPKHWDATDITGWKTGAVECPTNWKTGGGQLKRHNLKKRHKTKRKQKSIKKKRKTRKRKNKRKSHRRKGRKNKRKSRRRRR